MTYTEFSLLVFGLIFFYSMTVTQFCLLLFGFSFFFLIHSSHHTGPEVLSVTCPHHSNIPLVEKQHRKKYICDGCNMGGKDTGYVCPDCDYGLHSVCNSPSNRITLPFLKNHKFEFMEKPIKSCSRKDCNNRYCDACGMTTTGYVYHCYKNGMDLHPCCASKLESCRVIDEQVFYLNIERKLKSCDLCKDKSFKGSDDRIDYGWFYATKDGSYKRHVYCIMEFEDPSTHDTDLVKLESLSSVKKNSKKQKKKKKKKKKKKGAKVFMKVLLLALLKIGISVVFC